MAKEFVVVKGKVVKMNDKAFKIASKHFGATKGRPDATGRRAVPAELLALPKLPITPAVKVVKQAVETPIEIPAKVVEEVIVPEETKEVKVIKRRTRKK
jgi:hypothetical protein